MFKAPWNVRRALSIVYNYVKKLEYIHASQGHAMELDEYVYETFYETNDVSVHQADLRTRCYRGRYQWKLRCMAGLSKT